FLDLPLVGRFMMKEVKGIFMKSLDITVKGMTCASCVGRVERVLNKNPAINEASVNLATEKARVQFNPKEIKVEEIISLIEKAGYSASLEKETKEEKDEVLRKQKTNLIRSEEHTSELQSRENLVCLLLREQKKNKTS